MFASSCRVHSEFFWNWKSGKVMESKVWKSGKAMEYEFLKFERAVESVWILISVYYLEELWKQSFESLEKLYIYISNHTFWKSVKVWNQRVLKLKVCKSCGIRVWEIWKCCGISFESLEKLQFWKSGKAIYYYSSESLEKLWNQEVWKSYGISFGRVEKLWDQEFWRSGKAMESEFWYSGKVYGILEMLLVYRPWQGIKNTINIPLAFESEKCMELCHSL